MDKIKKYTKEIFEDIRHVDENGNEYWLARELQFVFEYTQWRRFENVINKGKTACENSRVSVDDHFANVGKMVDIGLNTQRKVQDYKLSRYACYLIAQNGDSRKEVIALAQTYFAIQTRKQELLENEYKLISEDEKRVYQRDLTRKGNLSLIRQPKMLGLKTLINFIMLDIEDYIMEKLQMILLKERG